MQIASILKDLREYKDITQKELAKACGISPQCVSALETGRNEPTASTLIAYAKFFNVSIDELLGRNDFTPEERAAGISDKRKVSITPIEDDMLYVFREIGKHFGEQAQRDYITVGENMLKLK